MKKSLDEKNAKTTREKETVNKLLEIAKSDRSEYEKQVRERARRGNEMKGRTGQDMEHEKTLGDCKKKPQINTIFVLRLI